MPAGSSDQASDVQGLIAEARNLVAQLYDPANTGNPPKIQQIQDHLQKLQRGPQAWLIANDLLSSDSTELRFFGALTFTVKVNLDWSSLSEQEAQELLGRLVDHFVHLVNNGERALVIRKLASCLTAIFLKPNAPWSRALLNVGVSIAHGGYVPEDQCLSVNSMDGFLPVLNQSQVIALLYLSNVLAEEIRRSSSETRKSGDKDRLAATLKDALDIAEFVLRLVLQQAAAGQQMSDAIPGIEAINSFHSWAGIRAGLRLQSSVPSTQIEMISGLLVQCLSVSALSAAAAHIVVEQLRDGEDAFTQEQVRAILAYLVGPHGQAHVASLMAGHFDDDSLTYLELLQGYACIKQRELLSGPLSPQVETVLNLLQTMFKVPGYAGVDDTATPLVLDWWTEAADGLQELYMDSPEKADFDHAKHNLAQACLGCFDKLMYPSPEDSEDWTDEDRIKFMAFRRDACDFFLAVYPVLGVELVQALQERAMSSLDRADWAVFEAACLCLAQLSEAIDGSEHADDCLNAIFFSDAFARLCDGVPMTEKARQTLVDMLGRFTSYFERTHALLPRVLTLLFASLDIESCATAAARSISHLCKSCCDALRPELPAFLSQFDNFQHKPTATTQVMEKVLEGIAAIIQTLSTDDEKASYLERILHFLLQQAEAARAAAGRGMLDIAGVRAQMALRCAASVGRGLRADIEINLDSHERNESHTSDPSFWTSGKGAVTQGMIVRCLQLLIDDFPVDIGIVQAACEVLKAGYTEKTGAFVFPPAVTVNFVRSISARQPGADVVMATASAFLASHSSNPQSIRDEAVSLILHVYETFLWIHERPENYDPELANSGLDFLTRLLPKYHDVLFSLTSSPPHQTHSHVQPGNEATSSQRPHVLQTILDFTLLSLQASEPLPLRSASQFWVAVLQLPSATASASASSTHTETSDNIQTAVRTYIPGLCRVLMTRIAGRCARSDLEHLCEVLRKLIFKFQGLARPHLVATLAELAAQDHDANSTRHGRQGRQQFHYSVASPEERERFVASLMAARGGRVQTIQLVRAFWISCRGDAFGYA